MIRIQTDIVKVRAASADTAAANNATKSVRTSLSQAKGDTLMFLDCLTGGTSTLDGQFNISPDNSIWYDSGDDFTQVTTGALQETKALSKMSAFAKIIWTLGGTHTFGVKCSQPVPLSFT